MNQSRRRACGTILKTLALAGVPALSAGTAEAHPRQWPRFRVVERMSRRLNVHNPKNGPPNYEFVESGRFDLDIRLPLSELNPEAFSADTPITIRAVDTVISVVMGDDPEFTLRRRRVELLEEGFDEVRVVPFVLFQLLAHWNAKELRIIVQARTPDGRAPITAHEHLGEVTSLFKDSISATVTVGGASFDFQVNVTGRAATHTVIRDKREYELSDVRLSGIAYADGWEK